MNANSSRIFWKYGRTKRIVGYLSASSFLCAVTDDSKTVICYVKIAFRAGKAKRFSVFESNDFRIFLMHSNAVFLSLVLRVSTVACSSLKKRSATIQAVPNLVFKSCSGDYSP